MFIFSTFFDTSSNNFIFLLTPFIFIFILFFYIYIIIFYPPLLKFLFTLPPFYIFTNPPLHSNVFGYLPPHLYYFLPPPSNIRIFSKNRDSCNSYFKKKNCYNYISVSWHPTGSRNLHTNADVGSSIFFQLQTWYFRDSKDSLIKCLTKRLSILYKVCNIANLKEEKQLPRAFSAQN